METVLATSKLSLDFLYQANQFKLNWRSDLECKNTGYENLLAH